MTPSQPQGPTSGQTPTRTLAARDLRPWVWAGLFTVLGALLCALPLFDVLGYEMCLVLALPASWCGAHLGASAVWRARHQAPPSLRAAATARPLGAVVRLWGRGFGQAALVLSPALALATLNQLRVRNCDYLGGLGWFAMVPLGSAAAGAALGVVVALARPWRRRATPTLLAVLLVLASVGWGLVRFYAAPPIFGYDPFVGYFAGALYDEDVSIGAAFVWARLYHAVVALAALALAAALLDGARLALGWPGRGRARAWLTAGLAVALALGLHARRARLGFQLDAADVARALGAERVTPHFVLHYSPHGPYAKDIELYALDDERLWSELGAVLGAVPDGPVHAYLFDSVAQKRALMGAAHTFIAKPWRREIYLQHEPFPQPVTRHELAHVFAGRFGDRLFGTARVGLLFNVGLIEGVAVAAAWNDTPLTAHQRAKVLLDAGLLPPLQQVLSTRFLGLNAGQAYAVAGSFCRFLLDTRGAERLRALYADGGRADAYVRIYGAPLAALEREWRAFIDRQPVPPAERALALEWLRRPSVFHQVCAHVLAQKRAAAARAAGAGDRARAAAELGEVCALDPDDPDNLLGLLDLEVQARDAGAAAATAERLLGHPKLSAAGRARAAIALGDLALAGGHDGEAAARYRQALGLPLDEGTARLVTVKAALSAAPPGRERDALVGFLVEPAQGRDAALDLMHLQALVDRGAAPALPRYLLGRQLFNRDRWGEALSMLTPLADAPTAADTGKAGDALPDARFTREVTRLLAIARFRSGDYALARAGFEALAHDPAVAAGSRGEAAEWVARCDWWRLHAPAAAR